MKGKGGIVKRRLEVVPERGFIIELYMENDARIMTTRYGRNAADVEERAKKEPGVEHAVVRREATIF